MPTIEISRSWHKAIEVAPPEGAAIAFIVQGHPVPIAGYFESNTFYQTMWDDVNLRVAVGEINAEVEMWRLLNVGAKQESESSFAVLVGDR